MSSAYTLSFVQLVLLVFLALANVAENKYPPECCYTEDCCEETSICQTDYVVIGVGTAGSLIITNLTSDHAAVGLEVGGYHNNDTAVNTVYPPFGTFLEPAASPEWSANFGALEDPGILNAAVRVQSGRMLGGSGNHNYLYVAHPSEALLNQDYVPVGGPAWSYPAITNIMNNYENFHGSSEKTRGTAGPINIQQVVPDTSSTSLGNRLFTSLITYLPSPYNTTTPIVTDYNVFNISVCNKTQYFWKVNTTTGTIYRSSTGLDYTTTSVVNSKGYGVNGRQLRIKFGALVDKILFDGNKSVGVQYTVNGSKTLIVQARKRIILSANAIYSPVILQRSGYGDKTVLKNLGINVVYDNPAVGQNLQNHIGSYYIVATNATVTFPPLTDSTITQQAHISVLPAFNGRRQVQLIGGPFLASTMIPAMDTILGLDSLPTGFTAYGILGAIVHPSSRGTVTITSKEPSIEPMVFPGFYSNTTDLQVMEETWWSLYQALKYLRASDPTHAYLQIYPPESAFQGAKNLTDIYIQGLPFYHYHWSSTCSMGTVVNGNLTLLGVEGVTVADVSIAPVINDGNPGTMATFTAQRAVDVLRQL